MIFGYFVLGETLNPLNIVGVALVALTTFAYLVYKCRTEALDTSAESPHSITSLPRDNIAEGSQNHMPMFVERGEVPRVPKEV